MDILQENMHHLLPGPPGQVKEARPNSDPDVNEIRNCVTSSLKDLLHSVLSWEHFAAVKILQATDLICVSMVVVTLEGSEQDLLEPLALATEALQHVVTMPQLFQDAKRHAKYMRAVLHIIKSTKKVLLAYDGYQVCQEHLLELRQETVQPRDRIGDVERDRMLWPAWSSNTIGVGSKEQRKAIVCKSDFEVISSYLPRGGCAIVEQWRADVDEVVGALLEDNYSKEAAAQSATRDTTYLSTYNEGDRNLSRTTRIFDQPGSNLYARPMCDPLLSLGQVLSTFEGLEPAGPGQQPFGVVETTRMNISRMREARDERASKLEDFGRSW